MAARNFGGTLLLLTVDPENIVLNRTSVRRTRIKEREGIAAQLNDDLRNAEGPFVLHWDGKLMPDIDGRAVGL